MAFFDELGKKISQTSQDVVQKTKDTAEIMKLNGMISDEEKQIANFYNEIGKRYFELHKDSPEPDMANLVTAISNSKGRISEYSEQVKKLKGIINCPICGAEISYGAPFCSTCGAQISTQPAAAPIANNNVSRCVNCGATLAPNSAFCTKCGTKAAPAPQPAPQPAQPVQPAPQPVQPVVNRCPNCGKEIAANSRFCVGCGFQIGG